MNCGNQDSFARGDGVAEREERWLRIKIGVERQRALGETVFAGTESSEPGIAVGQTPGENGFQGVLAKNVFEKAAVDFADETIALWNVGGEFLIVHIQFRYIYLQLEFFHFL